MKYLLDTKVISEPMEARLNAAATDWLVQVDEDSVCLSVVTFTETTHKWKATRRSRNMAAEGPEFAVRRKNPAH